MTFDDVNPCTGEDHAVTLNFADKIHIHESNFVLTSKRTGTTDDGFVMKHGRERWVDTSLIDGSGIFSSSFVDIWRNDTTGAAFTVRGVFVFESSTDTVRVDQFVSNCLGS